MNARRILAPSAIVLFAAVFFAPELFGGRVAATANMARWFPWRAESTPAQIAAPSHNPDCNLSYYPRRDLLHEAWRARRLPLWNPDSFAGAPFLADIQSGVFYPPNWILLPFDPKWQLGAFLFLHAAWGGLGLFALVRRLGSSATIATLAGCAFALNGYFIKHFGQPPFLATASWVPWVMIAAFALRDRPSARRIGLFALAAALLFLAGQPQTAAHAALATSLVLLVREWTTRRPARAEPAPARRASLGRAALAFAAAGALALLLVAAQLLPTAELARRSARAELPYSTVISGSFHPVDAIRFLVEEFFGSPLTEDEWSGFFPRGDGIYIRHQLNSIFAGTPLFILALFGALSPGTRRRAAPWSALFVVAALLAFGSPLARLAYEILPGFRFSRIDRIGFFVVFAQSVLAALAAQEFAERAGESKGNLRVRRVFGAAVVLCAILGAVFATRAASTRPRLVPRAQTAALFGGAAGLALLAPSSAFAATAPHALAALQLARLGAPYRGDRRPEDVFAPHESIARLRALLEEGEGGGRMIRFGRDTTARATPLSNVLPPSTNVPYGLRDLQGYNALADSSLGRTLETALGEPLFSEGIWAGRRIVEPALPKSLEHPLLDALAVRAALSDRDVRAAGWTPVATRGFRLLRNEEALGRLQLHSRGRGVSPDSMRAILAAGNFDPRREAIWVGDGELGTAAGPSPPSAAPTGSALRMLVDDAEEIVARTDFASPSLFVVADSWDPGWTAQVDGNDAKIERVWGVVRGVRLEAGSHLVEMRYAPFSLRLGSLLSLVGLVLAGVMIAWTRPPSDR